MYSQSLLSQYIFNPLYPNIFAFPFSPIHSQLRFFPIYWRSFLSQYFCVPFIPICLQSLLSQYLCNPCCPNIVCTPFIPIYLQSLFPKYIRNPFFPVCLHSFHRDIFAYPFYPNIFAIPLSQCIFNPFYVSRCHSLCAQLITNGIVRRIARAMFIKI